MTQDFGAAKLIDEQAAEIERLRAASIEYQNALDDVQNLKEQIETFHLRRENELRQMNEISWQNKTQTARIKELETQVTNWTETARQYARNSDYWQDRARKAEGKIGPDARPPCWQITDERKAALRVMGNMNTLIVCPHCKTPIEFADIPKYMAVLRVMLDEAGQ